MDHHAAAEFAGSIPNPAKLIQDRVKRRLNKVIPDATDPEFVKITGAISEGMAEKLRPKVVAMIAAGRERAKVQADADECRESKLPKTKPGSAECKKRLAQLKGRPDEGGAGGLDGKLRTASAKFDDALREVLKIADAQWGREVMMEVLREEVEK